MEIIIAIVVFIIIYFVQKKLYTELWDKNLMVDIRFNKKYVHAGESAELIEVVNNAKLLPLTVLHLKYSTTRTFIFQDNENTQITDFCHRNDVFSVMGNQKVTRKLEFQTTKRGYFEISAANIIVRDFFLTDRFVQKVSSESALYVFPKKRSDNILYTLFQTMLGEIETKKSLIEDFFSFRGIREYSTTDSMRKINWKATAKKDELMVNLYHHTAEQKVKILLNLEANAVIKTDYIMELCISIASTAAEYFVGNEIPVMLKSNGRDQITKEVGSIDYGSARNHQISIDQYLARLKDNAGLNVFLDIMNSEVKESAQDVTYLVISSYRKEDLLMKLDYMVEQGASVYMISPCFDIEKDIEHRDYIYDMEMVFNETVD